MPHLCPVCNLPGTTIRASTKGLDGRSWPILTCPRCGIAFVGLDGAHIHFDEVYDEHFYRPVGRTEEMRYTLESHVMKAQFAFLSKHLKPGRALDVGSGDGVHLKLLQEAGWEAWGVEVSSAAVEYTKEKWGIEALLGEVENVTLPEGSFDFVQMRHVMEHLTNPRPPLEKIWRVLKPGGILKIDTPNIGLASKVHILLYERVFSAIPGIKSRAKRAMESGYWILQPPMHNIWFSKKGLEILLTSEGFQLLKSMTTYRGNMSHYPDKQYKKMTSIKGKIEYFFFYLVDILGSWFSQGNILVIYARKPQASDQAHPEV